MWAGKGYGYGKGGYGYGYDMMWNPMMMQRPGENGGLRRG